MEEGITMSKAKAFKDAISPEYHGREDQMSEAMDYRFGKIGKYEWEGKNIWQASRIQPR